MTPYYERDGITIYHGDARDVLPQITDGSIDLVFTDPPYLREFLGLYDVLAREAARVGKEGSFVYAYSGSEHLPATMASLAKELQWFWLHNVRHRSQPRAWHKKLIICSKPVFAFTVGEPDKARLKWMPTDSQPDGQVKALHPWQQGIGFAHRIIAARTSPGEIVLDPFLGSGTTLRAAKDLGRGAIGIEIEEKYCKIAVERLSQEVLPIAVPDVQEPLWEVLE